MSQLKVFRIPITYQVETFITVKAKSLDDAVDLFDRVKEKHKTTMATSLKISDDKAVMVESSFQRQSFESFGDWGDDVKTITGKYVIITDRRYGHSFSIGDIGRIIFEDSAIHGGVLCYRVRVENKEYWLSREEFEYLD